MLKSMTAYGRGSSNTAMGHFEIEIQSVNRKFLEINVLLPREIGQFDIEVKKWLLPHIARGQITVKINCTFEGAIPFMVRPNLPLARQMKNAWQEIAVDLNVKEDFRLSLIQRTEDLFSIEGNRDEEENYRQFLQKTFEIALNGFLQMKTQEGKILQEDVSQRLEKIEQAMKIIEKKAPFAPNKFREKLISRLEELMPGHVENEDRILREVAIFAEKIDITEEITRFHFHLTHIKELLQSSALTVGKTMEFVLQELNREVNTMGSKSSDLEISRSVIEIKSELERIREQIQNVE